MSAAKKKKDDTEKCEACDVLGDYMCAGVTADRPGRAHDKRRDEPAKKP